MSRYNEYPGRTKLFYYKEYLLVQLFWSHKRTVLAGQTRLLNEVVIE
jgi:hypothetical protein